MENDDSLSDRIAQMLQSVDDAEYSDTQQYRRNSAFSQSRAAAKTYPDIDARTNESPSFERWANDSDRDFGSHTNETLHYSEARCDTQAHGLSYVSTEDMAAARFVNVSNYAMNDEAHEARASVATRGGVDEAHDTSMERNIDDTHPDWLEAIAHAMIFAFWIALLLAFSHWTHMSPLLCTGTMLLVKAVVMYDLFLRRREHRAIQTLLVIWSLWLLYSVLAYGYHYYIISTWAYGIRDAVLTLQIGLLVGLRMLPARISQNEYGAQFGRRLMDVIGHERVNAASGALNSFEEQITHQWPARMREVDNGTAARMGKELQHDCFSFRLNMRQNLGVRFFSCDSRAGFVLYQMLLLIPFVQNSAIVYNPYWSVGRLTASYVLYKVIDSIFRPRVPGSVPQVSASVITTLAQYPLYTHPYIMLPVSVALVLVFSCICHSTYQARQQHSASDSTAHSLQHFDEQPRENTQQPQSDSSV